MKPLKIVQLGAAIGMTRSILLDKFNVYSNDVTESPILARKSLCIVGVDNGSLITIDLKKELDKKEWECIYESRLECEQRGWININREIQNIDKG